MNVNFGLLPPLARPAKKADRKKLYTDRGRGRRWRSGWRLERHRSHLGHYLSLLNKNPGRTAPFRR